MHYQIQKEFQVEIVADRRRRFLREKEVIFYSLKLSWNILMYTW